MTHVVGVVTTATGAALVDAAASNDGGAGMHVCKRINVHTITCRVQRLINYTHIANKTKFGAKR